METLRRSPPGSQRTFVPARTPAEAESLAHHRGVVFLHDPPIGVSRNYNSGVFERATPRGVAEVDEEWIPRLEASIERPEVVEFIHTGPHARAQAGNGGGAARGRLE